MTEMRKEKVYVAGSMSPPLGGETDYRWVSEGERKWFNGVLGERGRGRRVLVRPP